MAGISLRSPRAATAFFAVILLTVLAVASWCYVEHRVWPSARMPDLAYEAGEESVRQISAVKDGLVFAGLGLDPGAEAHLRKDGNYEAHGWVELVNEYGHRIHQDWLCVLRFDGMNGSGDVKWTPIFVQVGKHTAGTYVPE